MMTLRRPTRAMTLLFASTCIAAGVARAQVVVYAPAVHLSTGLTHAEAVVQTVTQIKMLKDMIENSLRSGSPSWGELNEILNQIDCRHRFEVRITSDRIVEISDIRVVMAIMVNFHRHRIDCWFQRVVRIRKGRKFMSHVRFLSI